MKKLLILFLLLVLVVSCVSQTKKETIDSSNIITIGSTDAPTDTPVKVSDVPKVTEPDKTSSDDTKSASVEKNDGVSPSIKEIEMTSKNFEFSPSEIRVKEGDEVKLKITTEEGHHGIGIPIFGVHADLPEGSVKEVTFVASKKGTFPFYCNVPCGPGHKEMKGTLIVE